MKKVGVIVPIVLVVIALIVALAKFNPFGGSDITNVELYRNGSNVSLSDDDKNTLINFLKKDKLKKEDLSCNSGERYKIVFDGIELSFDDNSCVFYKNNNNFENYYTSISTDAFNFIESINN